MSQANVEIVKTMIDTWEAHGFDATIAAFDPDLEVVDLQSAMGMKDRARGPEGLRQLAAQWTEIFDPWRVEVLEVVDLGGEWVMAPSASTESGATAARRSATRSSSSTG